MGDNEMGSRPQEGVPGELVARLEAASVGSRELDAAVHLAAFPDVAAKAIELRGGFWRELISERPGGGTTKRIMCAEGHYTTSLDAALALAERTIARRGPIDMSICGSAQVVIHHHDPCGSPLASAFGKTPALALCIAILQASETAQ